jgi:hypothetical protein
MPYAILPYTQRQARRIGVEVRPSKKKDKKIDVYRGGRLIASVGARGYPDYPHYLRSHSKEYANERRELYKTRHSPHREKEWTPSWLADQLLW